MIPAPRPAASRTRHSALAIFSAGSREQAIWINPTRNFESFTILILYDPSFAPRCGVMSAAGALVLFDIDGTLIRRAGPHHREALVEAVRSVTGFSTTTDHIPVHGMLDPDILTRMMHDAGAADAFIKRHMGNIIQRAQGIYVRRCPDLRRRTCPGVRRILYSLTRRAV